MSVDGKKQAGQPVEKEAPAPAGGREQMIIFTVGDQRYCIPILSIKEIREFEDPTYLPHCPGYVEGAINIRGNIVTVVNLANYLGTKPEEDNERRVVIIIEDGTSRATCGLLVDSVIGITDIVLDEIQPISVDGGAAELSGLVSIGERVIRILRLDTVLARLLGDAGPGAVPGTASGPSAGPSAGVAAG